MIKTKRLYLIGGTMGVGKTSVCKLLKEGLSNAVFLDGDWCWDASPFQVTEETKSMVLDNICYLLNSFLRCSVYDHIIFCWVMHEQCIIDAILKRLEIKDCELRCVSLVADENTIRDRLKKDVLQGIRTIDLIDRSIGKIPLYQRLNTIKIVTDGKTMKEVAKELKDLF